MRHHSSDVARCALLKLAPKIIVDVSKERISLTFYLF